MKQINFIYFESPFGKMLLGASGNQIVFCEWVVEDQSKSFMTKNFGKFDFIEEENAILLELKIQLNHYFSGIRKEFDVPMLLLGSKFQLEVWNELMKIPFGKTISYKEQSERMKNPLAIRAMAASNGANPMAIIIPCHRVIGQNGSLTGYAGGIEVKKKLLQHEIAFSEMEGRLF